jgi:hypothetical protein
MNRDGDRTISKCVIQISIQTDYVRHANRKRAGFITPANTVQELSIVHYMNIKSDYTGFVETVKRVK